MPDPSKPTTVIGSDTHIKGEVTFESTARIHGTVEGQINTKGELQIAEGATCKAGIEAGKVLVEGTVEGDITAKERLELSAKSKVKGDITAARLVVAEGAVFSGHLTVGTDAGKPPAQRPGSDDRKPVIETRPSGMGVVGVR
jgi:cytoskeletal protein CcmA (bactofilin family)